MPMEKLLAYLEQARVTISHQLSRTSADESWYRRRSQKVTDPQARMLADATQAHLLDLKRQHSAISVAINILSQPRAQEESEESKEEV